MRRKLDDLSRAYDAAIVSLEIVGNDVGAQPEVVDRRCAASPPIAAGDDPAR